MTSALIFAGCAGQSSAQQTFPETKAACIASSVPDRFIVEWKDGHTSVESAADEETFRNNFVVPNLDKIYHAEHDQHMNLLNSQSGKVVAQSIEAPDWGQTMIQASGAWNQNYNGQGVIVAVVDSGVDTGHPQIVDQLYVNPGETGTDAKGNNKSNNGIDDDSNGYVDDVSGWDYVANSGAVTDINGHGTHVSGIILAEHGKGDINGLAPSAKLLPLRFIDDESGDTSKALLAMDYARAKGAKVINSSWGGLAECSSTLASKIRGLEAAGILNVFAAGNSNHNLDKYPEYPAAYGLSGMMSIGASTYQDIMANFSNYSASLVDMMAPGNNIYSTIPRMLPDANGKPAATGGYTWMSGTSMAAPFVTGAAAVLYGIRPNATPAQIKKALMQSVDPGDFVVASSGRLNLQKAVAAIQQILPQ